jgi:hypothetical protein
LSNALKFTDKSGVITVLIKVLDHQLKYDPKNSSSIILEDLSEKDFNQYVSENYKKKEGPEEVKEVEVRSGQ